jgi:type I restriction enzyme S subunit
VSELPYGWISVALGEVGYVQSGMGFPIDEQGNASGRYPVYKVGDVSRGVLNDGGVLRRSTNYVDAHVAAKLGGHIFPEGAVLFAKIGEALRLNRRALVRLEGLADNNVMGFKAWSEVDDAFVFHFLKTQDLASLSRSTTVPSIRKGDVEGVTLNLPPAAEQKRIAQKLDELLTQVDTLKTRIDAIPALLKRLRQSTLAGAASGLLRDTSGASAAYKELRLGEELILVPDGWMCAPLGQVINPAKKLCYGIVQPGENADQGVDMIRVCDIEDGEIAWQNVRKVTRTVDLEYRRSRVRRGDVVMSIVGSIGRAAIVQKDSEANIARAVARIAPDPEKVLSGWIFYWLSSPIVQWWLVSSSKEVARKTLNLKELSELPVPIPPLAEQTEIVRRVDQLFAFADQLEAKVATAKQRIDALTQSILAKAFRGELVPQDPNDEPASVLLERIRAQRAAAPKAKRGRGREPATTQ